MEELNMANDISMGNTISNWNGNGKELKTITLCVTEDCNLVCKYCYMTGKNNKKKMSFDTAQKCIDYFINNREVFSEEAVVWEFIGGEPFLEIDLIDKICDYIKIETYRKNHPWFDSYRFSFSTNGILYHTNKVQKFISKNKNHLSIGISVDGNKVKHDQQRIYPNGKGSYDDVVKNVPLWQEQFPNMNTKATFTHEDIPYLKNSIISLWNLGINNVAANVVFEDVWDDGDDLILENQLNDLADYVIENKLWDKYSVRFFDKTIGFPLKKDDWENSYCGAGKMTAVDCDGNFYPCIRFLDFSMSNKKGRRVGNIKSGIDKNKIRAFTNLTAKHVSRKECLECEIATGCAWCTGFNYDNCSDDSIFERATFNCNMHKATVRANKRFWNKYEIATGKVSPRTLYGITNSDKYIQILVDGSVNEFCDYKKNNSSVDNNEKMTEEVFNKAIRYAMDNSMKIVIIGNSDHLDKSIIIDNELSVIEIVDGENSKSSSDKIIIYHNDFDINTIVNSNNCIYVVDKKYINLLSTKVEQLSRYTGRINLVLRDKEQWIKSDLDNYKIQLEHLSKLIKELRSSGKILEISVITDSTILDKPCNCNGGVNTFMVSPSGKFYVCPGFYYDDRNSDIGCLDSGISTIISSILQRESSPLCEKCDIYHCKRCVFKNKKVTSEYNIPSEEQCLVSKAEKCISDELIYI